MVNASPLSVSLQSLLWILTPFFRSFFIVSLATGVPVPQALVEIALKQCARNLRSWMRQLPDILNKMTLLQCLKGIQCHNYYNGGMWTSAPTVSLSCSPRETPVSDVLSPRVLAVSVVAPRRTLQSVVFYVWLPYVHWLVERSYLYLWFDPISWD